MPQGRPKSVPKDLLPPRPISIAEYADVRLRIALAPTKRQQAIALDEIARAIIDALALVLEAEAKYQPGLSPDSLRLHARGIVRGLIESHDI
jgi:hypothetical protein